MTSCLKIRVPRMGIFSSRGMGWTASRGPFSPMKGLPRKYDRSRQNRASTKPMATCDWRRVMLPNAMMSATTAPMTAPAMKPSTMLPVVTATTKLPMAERGIDAVDGQVDDARALGERLADGRDHDGRGGGEHAGQADEKGGAVHQSTALCRMRTLRM